MKRYKLTIGIMKDRGGRPAVYDLYRTKYAKDMVAWFKERENPVKENVDNYGRNFPYVSDFPSFYGFASKLGISMETMQEWREEHESFGDAWKRCKSSEAAAIVNVGMAGLGGKFVELYVKTQMGWMPKDEMDGKMPQVLIQTNGNTRIATGVDTLPVKDIEQAVEENKKQLTVGEDDDAC